MRRLSVFRALCFAALISAPGLPSATSAALCAQSAGSGSGPSLTTRELLDLHVRWRGGRDRLDALDFLERRGDIRIGGNVGTFRAVGSRDGWLRYDVKLDEVQQVEAVTPHGGWRWVNGELSDLDADRIEAFRTSIDEMFGRHLMSPSGYEASALGPESRGGETFEVLRLSNGDKQMDLFLDPGDGSLHWTREPDGDGPVWTRLSDWRFVDGVRFAFVSDRRPDDPVRRQLTEWKEVGTTGDLDTGEFLRPPEQSGTLEFDDSVDSAPFNLFLDGYIELDGEIRGRPVRVMLDSGAGITVLDRRFAEELGLRLREAGSIQGIGGPEQLFVARGVDVAVPGVTLRDANVAVLDLSEIGDWLGRRFEVILGVEVFTRALVTVDYPARRVSFEPPRAYDPPEGARSVRMYSRGGVPRIVCRFEERPETYCAVDTGSNGTVGIVARYVAEYDLLAGRPRVSRVVTGGVGGMIETPISTLRGFSFAGVPVGPVPANFMPDAVGSLDTDEIAGNIGASVLRSFVLVFDYPGMRFHVIRPADREPVRRDRTGLQAIFRGDHLEVFFVSPGSPAEAAGLEEGQRITAVDGRRVDPGYVDDGFRWRFGAPGTRVVLTDDLGREHALVLADFF